MIGCIARRVIGVLMICMLSSAGWADEASATLPPDQSIQQPTDQMRALIKQNAAAYRADKAKFYGAVDSILVPHFDIPYIAQEVLARSWRTATADQRQRFANAFKDMMVRSYADQLLAYNDTVNLSFQPVKLAPADTDTSVAVILNRPNAKPATIGFGMHLVSGQWKITDITIEDISLVLNFRTQVAAQIKQSSIDDVITKMENGQLGQPPQVQPAQKGSAG